MKSDSESLLQWGERARNVAAIMGGVRTTMLDGGFDSHVVDHVAPTIVFSTAMDEEVAEGTCGVQLPDGRFITIPTGSILRIDADNNLALEVGGMASHDDTN